MNKVTLPENPDLAGKLLDSQAATEQAKLARGAIGWILGTKDHVPNNVAGIVVIGGLVLIAAEIFTATDWASVKDQCAVIAGFVTTALGYLFGRHSKD